ncbi:MAG: calcium-binding protein, partial [Planctomycetota bacterium]
GIDQINGGDGDDVIGGRLGPDEIDGGPGSDIITGDEGNDEIDGGGAEDGGDQLYGGAGDDTIFGGGAGDHQMFGEAGNDDLTGSGNNDTLEGGGGRDTINGGNGEDVVRGGDDDDDLHPGRANPSPTQPPEYYLRPDGSGKKRALIDQVYGEGGNDILRGGTAAGTSFEAYYLDGGDGTDTLFGGVGFDYLIGRDGDDTLIGGGKTDHFIIVGNDPSGYEIYDGYNGDWGKDTWNPNTTGSTGGDDVLQFVKDINPDQVTIFGTGGSNNDTYPKPELNDGLVTDQAVNFAFDDYEWGRLIECVVTGNGDDTVTGTDRPGGNHAHGDRLGPYIRVGELILTGKGNDTINTGTGAALVDAGEGNDVIHATGNEPHYLIGGRGGDTFNIDSAGFANLPTSPTDLFITVADLGGRGEKIVLKGIDSRDRVQLLDKQIDGASGVEVRVDGNLVMKILFKTVDKINVNLVGGDVTLDADQTVPPPSPFDGPGNSTDDGKGDGKVGGKKPRLGGSR